MDTISHGLWGAVVAGRKNKRNFIVSFLFGIMPDIFSFGILFASLIFEWKTHVWGEPPPIESVPAYVSSLYNITHSLVVFLIIFGLVWLLLRRPYWPMSAWGLHILVDIPTHSYAFFPTPFLWPISDFKIDGTPWSSLYIFIPNVVLLITLYTWFFVLKPRRDKKTAKQNGER